MIEMEQSIIKIKADVYQRGGFSCWSVLSEREERYETEFHIGMCSDELAGDARRRVPLH